MSFRIRFIPPIDTPPHLKLVFVSLTQTVIIKYLMSITSRLLPADSVRGVGSHGRLSGPVS